MASYWSEDPPSDASDDGHASSAERREAELEVFRRAWKGELASSRRPSPPSSSASAASASAAKSQEKPLTPQEMAAKLFEQGVKEERQGHMFEAIRFYRNAVHLVPDIEQKMAQSAGWAQHHQQQKDKNGGEDPSAPLSADSEERTARARDGLDHLLRRWNKVLGLHDEDDDEEMFEEQDGDEGTRVWRVCSPEDAEAVGSRGHIGHCPPEVIALILRWVVSRDLDVRSLDVLSGVCRGFYQVCRDPELWRRICFRIWGSTCELPEQFGFSGWREMYLERPHPLFHGCYIAKISYLRHGENSFQDQFYRPWYQVDYYRYLRFFPEGRCLMLTTPDEPHLALSHLKSRNPRLGTVMMGKYHLHGDVILASMKRISELNAAASSTSAVGKQISRARRNRAPEERSERTFYLELQVGNLRQRANTEIVWKHYSVLTYYPERQVGQKAEFELSSLTYPPCRFSRVRSYTAASEYPLELEQGAC